MVTFSSPTHGRRAEADVTTSSIPVRTSETHPMSVSWVAKCSDGGRFGLSYCPGKTVSRGGVHWCRSLDMDLERLKSDFGVTTILCLLNQAELASLKLRHYSTGVQSKGLKLLTYPIVDMAAPASLKKTAALIELLVAKLNEGEVMIIHCRGGVGRAGLIASCLLLHLKMASSAVDAISKVRKLRCRAAVESYSQEQFIAKYSHFIATTILPLPSEEGSIEWELFPKKTASQHKYFLTTGGVTLTKLQEDDTSVDRLL